MLFISWHIYFTEKVYQWPWISIDTCNETKGWIQRISLTVAKCSWVAFPLFWKSSLTDGNLSLLMEYFPEKNSRIHAECDTFPLLFSSHITEIANNDLFLFTDDSALCRLIPSKPHHGCCNPNMTKNFLLFDN